MKSQPNDQQRRAEQRYNAKQRALVLFPQDQDALPYHIIDISKGGLSFRYLGKKLNYAAIDKISLYHEFDLVVDSLPVTGVSDASLQNNLVPVRRGSICFQTLNPDQQDKLSRYIQQHTEPGH